MTNHIANDQKFGRQVFHYHPRSDAHSKMLCTLVLDDLLGVCPLLREHVDSGAISAIINASVTFPNGKTKTLDLAIGERPAPDVGIVADAPAPTVCLSRVRIACEAKQCMTEHSKTKPRIFDELSSSHEIVHQGDTNAIAAGIVVVNIADKYASPTRQTSGEGPVVMTQHSQPRVAESMVNHLKGLVMRTQPGNVGFDAFATIVIDCDNLGPCTLHTDPPAPQPGDLHHYETFLKMITDAYVSRFA